MSWLQLKEVTRRFGKAEVLSGIDLSLGNDEMLVVLGPTGAGKTTLLRIVAGLDAPDAGQVEMDGEEVTHWPPADRDIALVFQHFALYPDWSVRRNLEFPLKAPRQQLAHDEIDQRVGWAAELLKIERLLDRPAARLSGGEMQRVAIGQAIVRRPRLFLFDEPLTNLDAKLRESLRLELALLRQELSIPAIYVTHDQAEALSMGDSIAVLAEGRILQQGSPEVIYRQPISPVVARQLGQPAINILSVQRRGDAWIGPNEAERMPALSGAGEMLLGVRPEDIAPEGGPCRVWCASSRTLGPRGFYGWIGPGRPSTSSRLRNGVLPRERLCIRALTRSGRCSGHANRRIDLRNLSMWSALGIAAMVSCGQQEPTDKKEELPLAQVGTELITDRDIHYLIDNVAEWAKSEQTGDAKVREYLQSLINRALILREARAGKLDRSPAFASEVATALRRRLIREIEQRAVVDQVSITEEEMQRVFAEQNWERWIKIAHIVVPTQERAEEAMAALRTGTPFEEVAREFSTHSRTASLGGVKPQYYSRFHAVPLVRDVLFSLKVGEISEPIAVPQGYEIFKVLNELQGTYEQTRGFLFKTLSQERLEARRKAYADSLAEQFQLTPDSHGLGILMEILRSGREDPATGKMTFQIPEGAAETPLFRYEGGQIALGEAILQSPVIRQGRDVSDSASVVHFLQRDVIMPQLMWMEADKLELDRELEEWVKRKEEEVLIVTMRQIVTATDEEISEQEILDYYEETKDQYRTASEVSVVEIQLASEAEAEALLAEIRGIFRRASPLIDLLTKIKQKQQDGRDLTEEVQALQEMDDDLEVLEWLRQRLAERGGMETILEEIATASSPKELAEEYIMRQLAATRSLRPGARETEGHYHLYRYEAARFGDLVAAALEGEIGSLIGPMQVGPSYSIAKILSRRESKARPYEDRERQIRANIRKERERESFGRWLKDLRTSYEDEVRYFDENIEKLGRELTAEGRG